MTRFLYREDNFRLLRLKSEKYTKSGLTYTSNSGIKQNYSYEYDLSGNIINISDTTTDCGYGATPNALSRNFIYDALYRLLSATGRETAPIGTTPWNDLYRPENESLARGYTQQYSYDKLGNIQELQHIATGGNFTRTFAYDDPFITNKLNSITIGSNVYNFDYDVNGNMLSEGDTARHLEYDCADRLRCFYVQTPAAEPSKYTHYLYDGRGNRVKKITRKQGGSYTATTYIDGAFEYTKESTGFDGIPNLTIGTWVIGQYSSGGEQNILHLMGGATRRIGASLGDTTPTIKYNLSDHLGSSCVQLDTNGTTVSLEEYYPFGETSFGSYAKKRYRFCGKEKDEESGLYYYGMRYYSPWTCRFINVDPLAGKFPYLTPYQYASNDPIGATDLDGMESTKEPDKSTQQEGSGSTTGGTYHGNGEYNNGVHTVVTGNTLWNLSKRYGVSVDEIKKANNLTSDTIRPGQQLTIPGQKDTSTTDHPISGPYISEADQLAGVTMSDGNLAHQLFTDFYRNEIDPSQTLWKLNRNVKGWVDRTRPDLRFDNGIVGGVWELKPIGPSAALATEEAQGYVDALNKAHGDRFGLGSSKPGVPIPIIPPTLTDIKTGRTFEYTMPDPYDGAIYWKEISPQRDPVPDPVTVFVPKKSPSKEVEPEKHRPILIPVLKGIVTAFKVAAFAVAFAVLATLAFIFGGS